MIKQTWKLVPGLACLLLLSTPAGAQTKENDKPGAEKRQPKQITVRVEAAESNEEKTVNGKSEKTQIRIRKEIKGDGAVSEVKASGHVIVIGPNGKSEFKFDDADQIDLKALLEGQDLPEEVRAKLKEALKGLPVQGKGIFIGEPKVRVLQQSDPKGERKPQAITLPESRIIHLHAGPDGKAVSGAIAIAIDGAGLGGYMIGVHCASEIPAALDSQLNLKGQGVLIEGLVDDGPAAKAGMKANDIIVAANDTKVDGVKTLQNAVTKAGEDEGELKLVILRGGKKMMIGLKPRKSTGTFSLSNDGAVITIEETQLKKLPAKQMQITPGKPRIIRKPQPVPGKGGQPAPQKRPGNPRATVIPATPLKPANADAALQKQVKQLQQQLQELQKKLEALEHPAQDPFDEPGKPAKKSRKS